MLEGAPPIRQQVSRVVYENRWMWLSRLPRADLEHGEQALTVEEADLRVVYLSVGDFREAVSGGRIKNAPTVAAFVLLQLRSS